MEQRLWTVARFPGGEWCTGGTPDDPCYSECEIWQILASSRDEAKKKAQSKRSYNLRKSKKEGQMTNLSQWFLLSDQKPWDVGVYEVELGLKLTYCTKECRQQFQTWFSYWDGENFSCATGDQYRAFLIRSEKESSEIAVFKWRGLSTNQQGEV